MGRGSGQCPVLDAGRCRDSLCMIYNILCEVMVVIVHIFYALVYMFPYAAFKYFILCYILDNPDSVVYSKTFNGNSIA